MPHLQSRTAQALAEHTSLGSGSHQAPQGNSGAACEWHTEWATSSQGLRHCKMSVDNFLMSQNLKQTLVFVSPSLLSIPKS